MTNYSEQTMRLAAAAARIHRSRIFGYSEVPIDQTELLMLWALQAQPNAFGSELAAAEGVKTPQISLAMRTLEAKGWVDRETRQERVGGPHRNKISETGKQVIENAGSIGLSALARAVSLLDQPHIGALEEWLFLVDHRLGADSHNIRLRKHTLDETVIHLYLTTGRLLRRCRSQKSFPALILVALDRLRRQGSLSTRDIEHYERIGITSQTKLTRELLARGYCTVETGIQNRSRKIYTISPKGLSIFQDVPEEFKPIEEVVKCLTADDGQLFPIGLNLISSIGECAIREAGSPETFASGVSQVH